MPVSLRAALVVACSMAIHGEAAADLRAPSDLRATPIDGRPAIRLDWRDRARGETRYVVMRSRAGAGDWARVVLAPDTESWIDEDLPAGSPAVDYRLRAERGDERSPVAAASACHPRPDSRELILNGHFECGAPPGGSPSRPLGWRSSKTDPDHVPGWTRAPPFWKGDAGSGSPTRLLRVEQRVATGATSWQQRLEAPLEPDAWYRVSLDLASSDTVPSLDEKGRIALESKYTNAGVLLTDPASGRIVSFEGLLTHVGPELSEWDDEAWIHRSFRRRSHHGPRQMVRYLRTWDRSLRATAVVQTRSQGVLYVDNLSLRRVPADGSIPSHPPVETIEPFGFRGRPFFPTVLLLQPRRRGRWVAADELEAMPFNVVVHHRLPSPRELAFWPEYPALMLYTPSHLHPYRRWRNDPAARAGAPEIGYRGAVNLRSDVEGLLSIDRDAARRALFGYYTFDEIDCNPDFTWLDSLDAVAAVRRHIRDPLRLPDAYVLQNFCSDVPYTGYYEDQAVYLSAVDAVSRTANLPRAYRGVDGRPPELDRVGPRLRRSRSMSRDPVGGHEKPHLAYGFAKPEWGGDWRDRRDLLDALDRAPDGCDLAAALDQAARDCGPRRPVDPLTATSAACYLLDAMEAETEREGPGPEGHGVRGRFAAWASEEPKGAAGGPLAHLDKPYNLQRFLVMQQIIDGAVGVFFYAGWKLELENALHARQFEQVRAIARELREYRDILLEPRSERGWATSDSRVHTLIKRHRGNLYLFAASSAPVDLHDVEIRIDPSYPVRRVTALNEVSNGDFMRPRHREVACEPVPCRAFVDDFVGEDASAKPGTLTHVDPDRRGSVVPSCLSSPGYAVHVYSLELVPDSGNEEAPEPR